MVRKVCFINGRISLLLMNYTVRKILKENWNSYLKTHDVKDYQKAEVEKTINCSKRSCNSRICSSCGKRYTDNWADYIQDFLLPVKHKHVVLTVPSCIRENLRDWKKMKMFMDSSGSFFKKYFKNKAVLISILHTFGKDLKFNPHIHAIIANGFFRNNQFNIHDISFNSRFNKLWRYEVLKRLNIFDLNKHRYGFYVWDDKRPLGKNLSKYVSRYVRHPAIANGRIMYYDKKKVTFSYKTNNNEKVLIRKNINNFITSLIQHIPERQFKLIRYYGAYERRTSAKLF